MTTPILLGITRLLVGRRASGFVQVAYWRAIRYEQPVITAALMRAYLPDFSRGGSFFRLSLSAANRVRPLFGTGTVVLVRSPLTDLMD